VGNFIDFFGFSCDPFRRVPNGDVYYLSKAHQAAFDALNYLVQSDESFAVILGKSGTGKSITIKRFISQLPANVKHIHLMLSKLAPNELLLALLDELGTDVNDSSGEQAVSQLYNYLKHERSLGRYVLAILDEAHCLPLETVDELIQLTNLETENERLIKFVLVGEKTLLADLAKKDQNGSRFTIVACVDNLDEDSALDYINYRLSKASPKNFKLPGRLAKEVAKIAMGNPRIINTIMERFIVAAFLDNSHTLKAKHLHSVLNSMNSILPFKRKTRQWRTWISVLAVFFMTIITGLVGYTVYVKFENRQYNMMLTRPQNFGEFSPTPTEPVQLQTDDNAMPEQDIEATDTSAENSSDELPDNNANLNFAYVDVPVLNVRNSPNVTAERVGIIRFGQRVIIKEEINEWSLIEIADGQSGWVFKQYLRSE
jgi:general secretion pathway protein A